MGIRAERDSLKTAGQHHLPSDTGTSQPGYVVEHTGLRPEPVSLECLSTPRDLRPDHESPGTDGPSRGPSDPGSNHLGQLVDTSRTRTNARVIWNSW